MISGQNKNFKITNNILFYEDLRYTALTISDRKNNVEAIFLQYLEKGIFNSYNIIHHFYQENIFQNISQISFVEGEMNIQSIGDYAFYNCQKLQENLSLNIQAFEITDVYFGISAFENTNIKSFTLLQKEYNLISDFVISNKCFYNCNNLTSFNIFTIGIFNLLSINSEALSNCPSLQNIILWNMGDLATIAIDDNAMQLQNSNSLIDRNISLLSMVILLEDQIFSGDYQNFNLFLCDLATTCNSNQTFANINVNIDNFNLWEMSLSDTLLSPAGLSQEQYDKRHFIDINDVINKSWL